jgi:hypothetical protein
MRDAKLLLSTDGTTFRSPQATEIANTAQGYLDYLDGVLTTIDQAITGRLSGISQPAEGQFLDAMDGADEMAMLVTRRYIYITDSAASKYPARRNGCRPRPGPERIRGPHRVVSDLLARGLRRRGPEGSGPMARLLRCRGTGRDGEEIQRQRRPAR